MSEKGLAVSATQTSTRAERVADWPRITGTIRGSGDRVVHGFPVQVGTLAINGSERACEAGSVEELRLGMVARCVAIAVHLNRPVRFTVEDGSDTWILAVRPEGIVQLVDDAGMIPGADGLSVLEGRCRICRRLQPVTAVRCVQCAEPEPHRVEVNPVDVADFARADLPTLDAVSPPADLDDERPSSSDESLTVHRAVVDDFDHTIFRRPPVVKARPTLRLSFTTQHSVAVTENVALGRDPQPIGGRRTVAVMTPGRELSRTHALVDVDDDGRITVTDNSSTNGTQAKTDPAIDFPPGIPYEIAPGTTLVLGDVECTVTVVSAEGSRS